MSGKQHGELNETNPAMTAARGSTRVSTAQLVSSHRRRPGLHDVLRDSLRRLRKVAMRQAAEHDALVVDHQDARSAPLTGEPCCCCDGIGRRAGHWISFHHLDRPPLTPGGAHRRQTRSHPIRRLTDLPGTLTNR